MKRIWTYSIAVVLTVCFGVFFSGCKERKGEAIKISVIFPLTGNTGAAMSNNVKNALILCIDSFNIHGGINGQKIDIDFFDCKNAEPKEGVNIANRLVNIDKPDIAITMISGVVLSVNPIFEKNKILNLAIASTGNLFKEEKKYTLRTHLSTNQTGLAIAKAIKYELKKESVKIIYANTEFGNTSLTSFLLAADSVNLNTHIQSFEEKDLSYRNNILKLELNEEDIVYAIGIQESLGKLIHQIRQSGFKGIIIGGPDINSFLARDNIGDNKENIYYIETNRSENFKQFDRAFYDRYGEHLDEISVLAYNGLSIVLKCMDANRTNNIDTLMKNINGYTIDSYMGNSTFYNNEMIVDFKINQLN
jgi:ABC-type branched-subunit amino acid transport system substrate-binding protein